MTRNDRRALTQALALARNEDRHRAEQIDSMLKDRVWETVAAFAASCCQSRALRLDPWQIPPCAVDEDDDGDKINADAARLLRKMLAAGVSSYDPDPLQALDAAKKGAA